MPILDDVSFDPVLATPAEQETLNLAAAREELARLRYMLILTARWESSDRLNSKRRAQLRTDLVQYRSLYSQKIDEIAMAFGIQQAMEAVEHVERRVSVPQSAKMPGVVRDDEVYDI